MAEARDGRYDRAATISGWSLTERSRRGAASIRWRATRSDWLSDANTHHVHRTCLGQTSGPRDETILVRTDYDLNARIVCIEDCRPLASNLPRLVSSCCCCCCLQTLRCSTPHLQAPQAVAESATLEQPHRPRQHVFSAISHCSDLSTRSVTACTLRRR